MKIDFTRDEMMDMWVVLGNYIEINSAYGVDVEKETNLRSKISKLIDEME